MLLHDAGGGGEFDDGPRAAAPAPTRYGDRGGDPVGGDREGPGGVGGAEQVAGAGGGDPGRDQVARGRAVGGSGEGEGGGGGDARLVGAGDVEGPRSARPPADSV